MKRFYHLSFIFLFVVGIFSVAEPIQKADAMAVPCTLGLCFGGRIGYVQYCNEGLLAYVNGIPFMWMYGTPIFGGPPSPGLEILGAATGFAICTIPCPVGACPIGGGSVMMGIPYLGTGL